MEPTAKKKISYENFFILLRSGMGSVLSHTILITVAIACLFPLLWMISSGLKTQTTIYTDFSLFPSNPQFMNFYHAFTKAKFGVFFLNSLFYTVTVVFIVLLVSSLAAYAFARFSFPGKNIIYSMFLVTLLIPVPGAIVALYQILQKFGLINTRIGYMLPQINGALAVSLFLLKPFFERIPKDLEDAAKIDGCGRLGIWWHVAMPLAKPALAVVALFTALNVWNEFIFAQLVLQSQNLMPLNVGLIKFWGGALSQDHLVMAGATITVLPIIVVYIFLQRHIISGVTAGALKG